MSRTDLMIPWAAITLCMYVGFVLKVSLDWTALDRRLLLSTVAMPVLQTVSVAFQMHIPIDQADLKSNSTWTLRSSTLPVIQTPIHAATPLIVSFITQSVATIDAAHAWHVIDSHHFEFRSLLVQVVVWGMGSLVPATLIWILSPWRPLYAFLAAVAFACLVCGVNTFWIGRWCNPRTGLLPNATLYLLPLLHLAYAFDLTLGNLYTPWVSTQFVVLFAIGTSNAYHAFTAMHTNRATDPETIMESDDTVLESSVHPQSANRPSRSSPSPSSPESQSDESDAHPTFDAAGYSHAPKIEYIDEHLAEWMQQVGPCIDTAFDLVPGMALSPVEWWLAFCTAQIGGGAKLLSAAQLRWVTHACKTGPSMPGADSPSLATSAQAYSKLRLFWGHASITVIVMANAPCQTVHLPIAWILQYTGHCALRLQTASRHWPADAVYTSMRSFRRQLLTSVTRYGVDSSNTDLAGIVLRHDRLVQRLCRLHRLSEEPSPVVDGTSHFLHWLQRLSGRVVVCTGPMEAHFYSSASTSAPMNCGEWWATLVGRDTVDEALGMLRSVPNTASMLLLCWSAWACVRVIPWASHLTIDIPASLRRHRKSRRTNPGSISGRVSLLPLLDTVMAHLPVSADAYTHPPLVKPWWDTPIHVEQSIAATLVPAPEPWPRISSQTERQRLAARRRNQEAAYRRISIEPLTRDLLDDMLDVRPNQAGLGLGLGNENPRSWQPPNDPPSNVYTNDNSTISTFNSNVHCCVQILALLLWHLRRQTIDADSGIHWPQHATIEWLIESHLTAHPLQGQRLRRLFHYRIAALSALAAADTVKAPTASAFAAEWAVAKRKTDSGRANHRKMGTFLVRSCDHVHRGLVGAVEQELDAFLAFVATTSTQQQHELLQTLVQSAQHMFALFPLRYLIAQRSPALDLPEHASDTQFLQSTGTPLVGAREPRDSTILDPVLSSEMPLALWLATCQDPQLTNVHRVRQGIAVLLLLHVAFARQIDAAEDMAVRVRSWATSRHCAFMANWIQECSASSAWQREWQWMARELGDALHKRIDPDALIAHICNWHRSENQRFSPCVYNVWSRSGLGNHHLDGLDRGIYDVEHRHSNRGDNDEEEEWDIERVNVPSYAGVRESNSNFASSSNVYDDNDDERKEHGIADSSDSTIALLDEIDTSTACLRETESAQHALETNTPTEITDLDYAEIDVTRARGETLDQSEIQLDTMSVNVDLDE